MITEEIYQYDLARLREWLTHEAGSSNCDYFGAKKPGGLKLQQVPAEYAAFLLSMRNCGASTYLELGIGNGGSFALNSFFLKDHLRESVAVDNLAYGELIGQNEKEVEDYILQVSKLMPKCSFSFKKMTTDEFFAQNTRTFDIAFVDADHSYEGVKKDYENALKCVNKGGFIVFHDINSKACPGLMALWVEVKKRHPYHEIIHSTNCGIGIIEV